MPSDRHKACAYCPRWRRLHHADDRVRIRHLDNPLLLSAASAVDHRLPDGNSLLAEPVPGLTGTPGSPAGGGSLHPSTHRCLVASPESVDATTGFLACPAPRAHTHRRGGHHPARRTLASGNRLVVTDETAPERPDMRVEVECIVDRSPRWPIGLRTVGIRGSSSGMSGVSRPQYLPISSGGRSTCFQSCQYASIAEHDEPACRHCHCWLKSSPAGRLRLGRSQSL